MLLTLLMPLMAWALWIDAYQAVKDVNTLKDLKIFHRKRQSVAVHLIERLSTFD
jgi:hypothetical protein